MKIPKYPSLERAAEVLKNQGFTTRFQMTGNRLRNLTNDRLYGPKEVSIVEYHRFRTEDTEENTHIIFALETADGHRGLIASQYDSYRDVRLLKFMDRVKVKARDAEMARVLGE